MRCSCEARMKEALSSIVARNVGIGMQEPISEGCDLQLTFSTPSKRWQDNN